MSNLKQHKFLRLGGALVGALLAVGVISSHALAARQAPGVQARIDAGRRTWRNTAIWIRSPA